jgi:hypothetical protein
MQSHQAENHSHAYRSAPKPRMSPEISELMHMLSALEDRLSDASPTNA